MNIRKHIKIITVIFYVFAGISGYLVLSRIISFVMPFLAGLILSVILELPVRAVESNFKLPRRVAAILVILLAVLSLLSAAVVAGAYIYSAAEKIISELLYHSGLPGLNAVSDKINKVFGIGINLTEGFKNLAVPVFSALLSVLKPIAAEAPDMLLSVLVFILSVYFLIVDKETILNFADRLAKGKFLPFYLKLMKISKEFICVYLKGQLIIMLITFIILTLGFYVMNTLGVLKLEYMFFILVVITILDALPVFGTGTVLIPWSFYGFLTGDFRLGLFLIAIYLVCMTVRQIAEPKIIGGSLGVHPLISLFAVFAGMKLSGVFGMIVFPFLATIFVQVVKKGAVKSVIREIPK